MASYRLARRYLARRAIKLYAGNGGFHLRYKRMMGGTKVLL